MDKAQVLDDAAIRKALGHSDYYAADFEDVLTAQRDADDTYYQQRITELETALEEAKTALEYVSCNDFSATIRDIASRGVYRINALRGAPAKGVS